ncbi:heat shock 70 kDa protein 12A-like isoform X1 [Dreissena polymorpha]|uniref:heat shock 70 kDa protein 12A-like isoform X1 n=1 Tax=Dreissena polymorpha TaxID=45954 RepID=UPI002264DD43|nr:heat shock 70 kDa protein 12A-like isoform X1 [Dreissena polymorpha]
MGGTSSKVDINNRDEDIRVIASIDFGTRYTGYAFILKDGKETKYIYRPNHSETKSERTCILLRDNDNAEFVAFGNNAMDIFDRKNLSEKPTGSDLFKMFIRKVAEKRYHKIKIVLEPEAASMYIRNKPLHFTERMHIEPFRPGQCYILVDIGAGTSDICAHKVTEDGNLIEILSAGIHEGGEQINKSFFNALEELFSAEVFNEFKKDNMRFHKLEKDFEEIKHKLKPNDNNDDVLLLDEKLLKLFAKTTGGQFEMCLKQSTSKFKTELRIHDSNWLYMNKTFVCGLFDPTINTIITHIQEQTCRATKAGYRISCILLSGGLSESKYVFSRIENHFSRGSNTNDVIPVIQAPNARNAVVDGALLMGLHPNGIIGRVSPYTYGFYSVVPFQEGEHPEDLKDVHEGVTQCKAVFYKLIERNKIVRPRDCFERRSSTDYIESKHQTRITSLWRSFRKDPKYCTQDDECELVASIEIRPPAEGWPPKLYHIQRLVVIDNEFVVEFENETTGQKYKTRVDYAF